jgi:hypothetical protein
MPAQAMAVLGDRATNDRVLRARDRVFEKRIKEGTERADGSHSCWQGRQRGPGEP